MAMAMALGLGLATKVAGGVFMRQVGRRSFDKVDGMRHPIVLVFCPSTLLTGAGRLTFVSMAIKDGQCRIHREGALA
jgi:hypothetical protein